MGDTILLHATPPTLPEDFCGSAQDFANAIINGAVFRLDSTGYSFFNFGDTTPAPEFRIYPWLRTILGTPDRWYIHRGNYWVSRNPMPPNGELRQIWTGTADAAGLWLFDGGDGTDPAAASDYTGAMWTVDTVLSGRVPVGVGTVGGTAVAVGNTGGAASVTLAEENLPAHSHVLAADVSAAQTLHDTGTYMAYSGEVAGDNDYALAGTDSEPTLGLTGEYGAAEPTPIVTIPPYLGVYFIKRTARVYYAIPD